MEQENIQKFIQNLRKENHLTQKQLADMLGVTYQAVSKWERGLNIPDISVLKEISRIFHVDIDTMINGSKFEKKKRLSKVSFFLFFFVFVLFLFIIILFCSNHDFYLKKVSSDCEDFTVTGSVAYNKDKSSIYISNIDYCGEEDATVYEEVTCSLYEEYQNNKKKINEGLKGKNISLDDYLKKVEIQVDDYSSSCKSFTNSKIYLEIQGKDKNGKVSLYRVPIKLDSNCK